MNRNYYKYSTQSIGLRRGESITAAGRERTSRGAVGVCCTGAPDATLGRRNLDREPELLETAAMRAKAKSIVILSLCLLIIFGMPGELRSQAGSVDYMQLPGLTGTRGGNLIASVNADPATFNRMFTSSLANVIVAERISADLVHINRSTFDLEPSLAKSWEVDKSGRIYTVHLRRGIRFSDGSPFTADDVIFTFRVLEDPKVESLLSGQIQTDGTFPEITKQDSHTVRITFPRPVGMGLRMLDSVPILPSARLLKAYQEGKLRSAWGPTTPPSEVTGLGAFRLKDYKRGEKIILERNPYFWKKDKSGQLLPYLDSITLLIIPDRNAEALRLKTGELDLVNELSTEIYADLRRSQGEGRYRVQDLGPGLRLDFLWFNLNRGNGPTGKPFVDPDKRALFERTEFRRAVSHAIDREGMARSILLGLGTPQYGPISSGNKVWYNSAIPKTAYDPSRANVLLDQLGLKDTDGDGVREYGPDRRPLDITLLTTRGSSARERIAQVLQENLAKAGIRMRAQLIPPNELGPRLLESFDYEAILYGFTPIDVAPDLQTDVWYSSGEHHFWHPRQPKPARPWEARMDQLATELVRNSDQTVRRGMFAQLQDLWARELPAIPIVAANVLPGWSSRVGNVRPSVIAPQLLWNAEELTRSSPSSKGR